MANRLCLDQLQRWRGRRRTRGPTSNVKSTVAAESKEAVTTGDANFRVQLPQSAAGRVTIQDFGGADGSAGFLVSLITIGGLGGLLGAAGTLLLDPNDVGSTTRKGALVGGTRLGRIGAAATNGTLPMGGDLDLVPDDLAGGEGWSRRHRGDPSFDAAAPSDLVDQPDPQGLGVGLGLGKVGARRRRSGNKRCNIRGIKLRANVTLWENWSNGRMPLRHVRSSQFRF